MPGRWRVIRLPRPMLECTQKLFDFLSTQQACYHGSVPAPRRFSGASKLDIHLCQMATLTAMEATSIRCMHAAIENTRSTQQIHYTSCQNPTAWPTGAVTSSLLISSATHSLHMARMSPILLQHLNQR